MRARVALMLFCFTPLIGGVIAGQGQPDDRVARLLQELSNAPGLSGFEGPVRAILEGEFRQAGREVSTHGLGSLIGRLAGPSDGPRIMLTAHMDEVGAIVRYITPEGERKRLTGNRRIGSAPTRQPPPAI